MKIPLLLFFLTKTICFLSVDPKWKTIDFIKSGSCMLIDGNTMGGRVGPPGT